MNEPDPNQVESLFQQALEQESHTREAFLDAACGGDKALRSTVEDLLRAAERVERKPQWSVPALHLATAQEELKPGSKLDRYEILERIGSGGMGVVYRAVRKDDRFSQRVALKIVHSTSPAMVERFHQERQILAELAHPHIARLLDVGATSSGSPFLAMEYIEGAPVDQYVKANRLTQKEILLLFQKIADSVSYAHRNLIVHRDLKPANILVTSDGEPKLLDFGIAKLIDPSAQRTLTGAAAMTPEYASPEQMTGGAITTATDVYSLGVLLYELLSGTRPYGEIATPLRLAEAITSMDPLPMSGIDPELANIVQMAMRKEPQRRYASVDQFADDIRRYQEGYPVSARADTRAYRLSKYVRRNKVLLIAAAVVAIAIVGGVAATVRQARIAERRFRDVRSLAHSYLFEVYDGMRDLQGSTAVRQLVVRKAIEYLDRLSQEDSNDVDLRRELANAYHRIGLLQGEPGMANLGDREGALVSYRKAMVLRERLFADAPTDTNRVDLAESYRAVGNLLDFQGQPTQAAELLKKALQVAEKAAAGQPSNYPLQDSLALSYVVLGNVTGNNEFPNLGDWKGAQAFYEKARDIRETEAKNNPSDRWNRLSLAAIYEKLAAVYRLQGHEDLSAEAFLRAIEIEDALSKEDPSNLYYRRGVAVDSRSLSLLYLAQNKVEQARALGDRSAQIFEEFRKADPNNIQAKEEVADSYWSQGFVLEKANDSAGAFRRYDQAVAAYEQIMKEHPSVYLGGRRTAYQLIAGLSARLGDPARATAAAGKELEIDDMLLKQNSKDVGPMLNRGVALLQIAQSHQARATKLHDRREYQDALGWARRSMDVWTGLKKQGLLNPAYSAYLGRTQATIDACVKGQGSVIGGPKGSP